MNYLCQTAERFFAVSTVLNNMVMSQIDKPSTRLLKHIIRCYNRLAENPRARLALRGNMPIILKDTKLADNLDESSKKSLRLLTDSIFNNENDSQILQEGGPFVQQQQPTMDGFNIFKKPNDFMTGMDPIR